MAIFKQGRKMNPNDNASPDFKEAGERTRKRRKKSKKRKSKPILFWGLLAGGAAAVVVGIVFLVFVFRGMMGNKLLFGEWESVGDGKKYGIEFTPDEKVYLDGDFAPLTDFAFAKPLKMLADFGIKPGRGLKITYRFRSDSRLEISANYLPLLEKLSAGAEKGPGPGVVGEYMPTETLTYAVTEQELTLTNEQGKSVHLRRRK